MNDIVTQTDEEVTVPAFQLWLKHARPGDRFEYHRGFLVTDREKVVNLPQYGMPAHVFYEPVHSVGQAAWQAYERGHVDLLQKKLDRHGNYAYMAVKRKGRTAVTRRQING